MAHAMNDNTATRSGEMSHADLEKLVLETIAINFVEEMRAKLSHPKCLTFFMSTDDVSDKLEEMHAELLTTMAPQAEAFTDTCYWELICLIKRIDPTLLQENDRSICYPATKNGDWSLCLYCREQGHHMYKDAILCHNCYHMVVSIEET